ncbi:MAG TPA: YadA-like family protein [Caulobacteraceae bacterium]|nr:YadA-like family protein [Caulobacteraceae bacterium]
MTFAHSAGSAIHPAGLATLAACLLLQGAAHAQAVSGSASPTAPCQQSGFNDLACGASASAGGGSVPYGTAVGYEANASGSGGTAIGVATAASGDNATALGDSAIASGPNDVAVGVEAAATSVYNTAVGPGAEAKGFSGSALGGFTSVTGSGAPNGNVALGNSSTDGGENSRSVVSVGNDGTNGLAAFTRAITNVSDGVLSADSTDAVTGAQLYATNLIANAALAANQGSGGTPYLKVGGAGATPSVSGVGSVGLGVGQSASGDGAVAIGVNNTAAGQGAVAIGANSTATGASALAIGGAASASSAGDVALGGGANVTAKNAVALGAGSIAARDNTVSVGAAGAERQITNVAAGSSGTDAVNVNQLNAASAATLGSANAYTDAQIASVRLDMNQLRRDMHAGVAGSDAINGIPQNITPGHVSVGFGMSQFSGSVGVAFGLSTTLRDGRTNARISVGTSTGGGPTHISGGASYTF